MLTKSKFLFIIESTKFIMDRRKLKSVNQYRNKQEAYFQSIADKQKHNFTKRLQNLLTNVTIVLMII